MSDTPVIDPRTLNLVPLSTVPEDEWIGLRVYHPMLQSDKPYWHTADYPEQDRLFEEECMAEYGGEHGLAFDVGLVEEVFYQDIPGWNREDCKRVFFRCMVEDVSYRLHYHPTNLWTAQ